MSIEYINNKKEENLKLIFGNALKEIKNSRKLTLRGLAKILDYSPSYISDLEKGNRLPSIQLIRKIEEKLNLTDAEKEMINIAYFTLHPKIPFDLACYIAKNDLLGTLQTLKTVDKDGTKLKKLVLKMVDEQQN